MRHREREICAAGKLLQVKIRFEEVSFKASFEGREGRVVTESERKRIPHLDSRDTLPIPPVTCVMNGESDFACDLMNCVSPSGHRRGCLPLRWLPIDARIKTRFLLCVSVRSLLPALHVHVSDLFKI